MFGANIEDDPDDIAKEERRKKIDKYLASLPPQKRKWEEKKLEHYRKNGKIYTLPGEKPFEKQELIDENLTNIKDIQKAVNEGKMKADDSMQLLNIE